MCIANINQCEICLNYRFPELAELGITETFYKAVTNWRSSTLFNSKEKLAIEYAELFGTDHLSIDDDFMNKLKEHCSSKEIFELTYTIAGLIANGRTLQVLQVGKVCSL